jgi:hypothetical protein
MIKNKNRKEKIQDLASIEKHELFKEYSFNHE